LKAAAESEAAVREFLDQFLGELCVAMQLTGSGSITELQRAPVMVTGASREWLELRGFGEKLRLMAQRGMDER
jgi:isopentenyl-diphosphate delta-isomerase